MRNIVFLLKRFLPFYPDFVLKALKKPQENAQIPKGVVSLHDLSFYLLRVFVLKSLEWPFK